MPVADNYIPSSQSAIPAGWNVRPLLSTVTIASGQVDPKVEPYRSMILVAPDHVESGTGRLILKKTAEQQNAISGKYLASAGDVIYSKIRPYLRKAVLADEECLCSADMYPMTPAPGVSGRFILAVILGEQFTRFAESVSLRTGMPKINREELATFEFPLPPEKEQRAIAEALEDVDALIESLERLIAKKRDIKQAVMQQLLTGKRRLPGFSGKWQIRSFGEICEIVGGGTPKTSEPAYWNGSIAWCTPTDITSTSGKYLYRTERTISDLGARSSAARLLPAGTLLLCSRATIGEVKIATGPITTNKGFKSLVCGDAVSNEFLYYKLLTIKNLLLEKSFGSTFLEISKASIASIEIELPRKPEQAAIAEVLSDVDSELECLSMRLAKTREIKEGMMQQLLTGKVRLI